MKKSLILTVLISILVFSLAGLASGQEHDPHAHHRAMMQKPTTPETATPETTVLEGLTIPSVEVVTQDGRRVDFRELVAGKVVAMNFVFTTCTTICPPMGANFSRLRAMLGEQAGREVELISVSVDPVTDTPERLRAWSEKFGAGPGWTLVTGGKQDITRLLKDLQVFTPDIREHSATVILGDGSSDTWTRAYGLAPPARLKEILDTMTTPRTSAERAARSYFTDVELVDQDGRRLRFYDDLLKDKIVVIDAIFTTCTGVCPVMSKALAAVQEHVGDRLGDDVHLISISLDPETDTPDKLKAYAERFGARPGWYFLTGETANVELALKKLGQWAEIKESHKAVVIAGNEPTGLWKKAFGLAPAEEIVRIVDSVMNDAS